jgi:hypothetical protein
MLNVVDDDEVLQLMTKLGLDSENEFTFRATRHYFRHRVPPCCIAFNVHLWDILCNYLPHDPRIIDRLLAKRRDTGMLCIARDDYFVWVESQLGKTGGGQPPQWTNGYTPCPRCTLEKAFVQIPNTCRCCADKAHDDDPKAP